MKLEEGAGYGNGYGANSNGYGSGSSYGGSNRGYGQSNSYSGGGANRNSGRWEMNGSSLSKPRWDSVATVEKNFYKEHEAVQKRPMEEIQNFLNKNDIKVKGTDVPRPIFNFNEAGFPDTITKHLYKSFQSPTIIQSVSWPVAMSGRNLVGIAQTGSGKTLAFLLPGILHISKQPPIQRGEGPIALILCPTRELAIQVQEVCSEYGQVAGLRSVCVYGGAPKGPQDSALRR
uniref:Helicase ATP-binding domain-containing protein n=1 Tax=Romanomermis culicivorax TaxID=13658 RepID=A0A915K8X2_ROMCU